MGRGERKMNRIMNRMKNLTISKALVICFLMIVISFVLIPLAHAINEIVSGN